MQKNNFDYSKTMWMKMFLAEPDYETRTSRVFISFEQALDVIRAVDALTQGIEKIVYLVGWQGLGHDDLYPDMSAVNDYLKRDEDPDGKASLLWLMKEAKSYHTTVSFHGNLADAYEQSPSFPELKQANAVANGLDGEPAVIEIFNGRNAYKVSYKQYYESGLFKKYWDIFCETVPVIETGTVHLDNFCIAENLCPETGVDEQNEARNKMLDYIRSLGIDVTTEYTYRELSRRADAKWHPIHRYYGDDIEQYEDDGWKKAPIHTLGRIAASWWMSNMEPEDFIRYPASLYSGFTSEGSLRDVYYGSMHGEDIWRDLGIKPEDWAPKFMTEFCLMQVPFFYLNRFTRERIEQQEDGSYIGYFSDGVESIGNEKSIRKNGTYIKKDGDVLLPLNEENTVFIAYSENGKSGTWNIPDAADGNMKVYRITTEGNVPAAEVTVKEGTTELTVKAGEAFVLMQ